MSPSPSASGWKRLGEQLIRRRVELDPRYSNRTLFCAERALDYRLVYDIEVARRRNFRKTTLGAIAAAYAVTLDSLNGVVRADAEYLEPVPHPPSRPDMSRSGPGAGGTPEEEALRAIAADSRLRPELRQAFIALAKAMKAAGEENSA